MDTEIGELSKPSKDWQKTHLSKRKENEYNEDTSQLVYVRFKLFYSSLCLD